MVPEDSSFSYFLLRGPVRTPLRTPHPVAPEALMKTLAPLDSAHLHLQTLPGGFVRLRLLVPKDLLQRWEYVWSRSKDETCELDLIAKILLPLFHQEAPTALSCRDAGLLLALVEEASPRGFVYEVHLEVPLLEEGVLLAGGEEPLQDRLRAF